MKKSTKGAVAAAAAGVLLLGGAGSLAFWSDSLTVGGDTISSGHLSLDDTTGASDICADSVWTLDAAETGSAFDPTTDELVPGDVLTKECTFDVSAVGNHLGANLDVAGGEIDPASTLTPVTVDASFTVGGATATSITESNDGDEVKATLELTFPSGLAIDNSSQDKSLDLSSYTVTATQAHS